jgi:hypothetical protein
MALEVRQVVASKEALKELGCSAGFSDARDRGHWEGVTVTRAIQQQGEV